MRFNDHEPLFGRLRFRPNFRVISGVLFVIIVVMFFVWKPWSGDANTDRTIEVRGESTISATPNEFVFYPTYESKNADKTVALAEMNKKSDEIVGKLKELGVAEEDIKSNSSAYDDKGVRPLEPAAQTTTSTVTLSLTITVADDSLVQKVQDYLVSTSPSGAVSPLASFSDDKRKALERTARNAAINDAKSKAEQTARKLGFKLGAVKSVSDGSDSIMPMPAEVQARGNSGDAMTTQAQDLSLGVHPGENKLPYSVTVVYFIR